MKTIKIDQKDPDLDLINEAVEVLSSGGVVLYPTDTVYGLGANIFNKKAVEKIYHIKNRDYFKPLSVCVSSIENVFLIADVRSKYINLVSERLPGPFTFVFYKKEAVPDYFAKNRKIGVRIPEDIISRELTQNFPITSTSANLAGETTLKTPKEIINQLNKGVDFVIDAGPLKQSLSSTVIDLTKKEPHILREGSGDFSS
jgi:L-threonylcarbamoyladenylate synthase